MPATRTRLLLRALERRLAPALFTVTNLFDAGAGSLRDAVTQLNLSTDPANAIDLTGVTGTITLATALPAIARPVDILGPGAAKLAVSGNNAVRVFNINNGGGPLAVSITGLTITAGKATGSDGGGIFLGDDVLTLREVAVTNCSSTTQGGGIGVATDGTVLLDACTVSGNTALTGGGVYFQYNGRFVIENSTISNNSATGAEAVGGGGLYFFGIAKNGASAIRNSTISGNSAVAGSTSGGGGVCLYQFSGTLDIENSTIVNNTVTGLDTGGGGLSANLNFTTAGVINLRSSIIAGNAAPTSYTDLFVDFNVTVISFKSAYDINPSGGGVANFSGTNDVIGAALNLGPLSNNGGPVQTHALLAGSAAIDKGFNAGPSGTDSRGPTFARKVGAAVDIGAFEFGSAPGTPTGSLSNLRLTQPGGTSQSFAVLWADDGAVDVGTLGNDDLRVTGPGGYNQLATLSGSKVLNPGRVEATYSVPAGAAGNPAKWDGLDNGVYTIVVEAGKVLDTLGNAVVADAITDLDVVIALPAASAKAPDIKSAQLGTTANTITVTYTGQIAISAATVGAGNVRVTGPGGFNTLAVFKSQSPGFDSTTVTAVYEITAPGGTWDAADLGKYTILLEAGQVTDADGIPIPAAPIGSFTVALPVTLVVNAANDEAVDSDGKTSLREALAFANASVADLPDTITFDSAVFGSATTVTLGLGELSITDGVILVGPGSALLTVKAAPDERICNVNEPNGVSTITISGMTLTGGRTGGRGAAIRLQSTDEKLTLSDMVFTDNIAADFGGAVGSEDGSGKLTNLTVDRCVFTANASTVNWGGAIYLSANTTSGAVTHGNQFKITNSTFEGNTANGNGGALYGRLLGTVVPGTAFFEGCLFVDNVAKTAFAGAFGFRNTPSGDVTVRNTTFSGNKALDAANGQGSAIQTGGAFNGTLLIQNSTFAFNQSENGGAIARTSGAATLKLESCIFFNNTAAAKGGADFNGGNVSAKNCVIFSTAGATTFSDLGGNQFGAAADPVLAPLANNGGLTKTHGLGPGSTAINKGSNPAGLAFDQRGPGFPRVIGAAADVGALEGSLTTPFGLLVPIGPIVQAGATPDAVHVVYTDDTGIDVATVDPADIQVFDPAGKPLTVVSAAVTPAGNGTPRTATYTFAIPVNGAAGWDGTDNGSYTVALQPGQVFDVDGKSAPGGILGGFQVIVPFRYVVDEISDVVDGDTSSGHVSFREAINLSNADNYPSTIVFDPAVFAAAQTILLTGGELSVTATVDIQGPAAGVTLDAGGKSRVIHVNIPGTGALSVTNMTMTNGSASGAGGAILPTDDHLTLVNCVVSNSKATAQGGGIGHTGSGNVGNWTLTDTTVSGNTGLYGGGLYVRSIGSLVLSGVTVSGNTSTSAASGGGLHVDGGSKVSLVNSTISGNKCFSSGAGIRVQLVTTVTVQNSTVTANDSALEGGGLYVQGGTLSMASTVVAGNTVIGAVTHGADVQSSTLTSVAGDGNLVGVMSPPNNITLTGTGNQTGTPSIVLNAGLGLLADNGGRTRTHGLLPGSPASNRGTNPAGLSFDQRGPGFPRVIGSSADVGAFEGSLSSPNGVLSPLGPIVTPGPTPDSVQVVYTDDTGIDVSTIDVSDIQILDPAMKPLTILGVSVTPPGNGTPRTATYTFAVPVNGAAGWDFSDDGTYVVNQQPGQVFDVNGNVAPFGTIGTFLVAVPGLYIVDEVSDVFDGVLTPGKLSIREAIHLANTDAGPSEITFDPTVFVTGNTILMGSGEMKITSALEIVGPAAQLTIDANSKSRIFNVDIPGLTGQSVTLRNIKLGFGYAGTGFGGAILANDEALIFSGVSIVRCAAWRGSAIAVMSGAGSVTATDCVLSTNTANAATSGGGAIFLGGASQVTISRCTLTGNLATGGGAAIWFFNPGGHLTVTDSTLSGNKASIVPVNSYGGGAIYLDSTTATLRNCTLSGNHALRGGAILDPPGTGSLTLQNCTVAFNFATDVGGGVYASGATTLLESTIISGNTAPAAPDLSGAVVANFSLIGSTAGAVVGGANNLLNTDPLLGTLANNGGSTKTHALLPGSPAINAGNNQAGLAFDQRGPGFPRFSGKAPDIGAFEVQLPRTVIGVQVNAGAVQRSRVTSVAVTFDQPVMLPANPADAFQLKRQSDNAAVVLSASVAGNAVTLNFIGGPVEFGSLADGRYTLTVIAAQVNGGVFDGNGDGTAGDDYVLVGTPGNGLFRLFGDADGDGDVDVVDWSAFRGAFGATSPAFDFEDDGDVDALDYGQFRGRFGAGV